MKRQNTLTTFISYALFPTVMAFGLFLSWSLRQADFSVTASMVSALIVANTIIWAFEFIQPFEISWRPPAQSLTLDIIYALSTSLFITPLFKLGMVSLIDHYNLGSSALNIWPHTWPLFFQVCLAILLADLVVYTVHRWMHSTKIGWRLHVIHHSTKYMNFWAGSRSHVFNVALVYIGEVGLLLLLGINTETLAFFTVFIAINGVFEHANIELKHGFLNRIISTAEVHRVHHSTNWDYSNSNFGTSTTVWDQVFGTYCLPEEEIRVQGIVMHQIPEKYLEQLKAPFVLDRYKVGANASPSKAYSEKTA